MMEIHPRRATSNHPEPDGDRALPEEALRKIAALEEEREALQQRVQELNEQVRLLQQILYGRSSEKRKPAPENQPTLPFDEAETEEAPAAPDCPPQTPVAAHQRQKPGRRPLPADLPRVQEIHDLDEADKVCACGCPKTCIGQDVSERLDVVPAKVQVRQDVRLKYACPNCQGSAEAGGAVSIAPLPPQIIAQGIVTASTLAHVVTAKFVDGIPLYRQEQQFIRLGLEISRGTLASWVLQVAAMCYLLGEMLLEELRAGPVIWMDETPVQVMREPGRANTTKSFMWVCRGGLPDAPVILFRYAPTRSGGFADDLLAGYHGYLQTDGYAGYELLGKRPGIVHQGCFAHVRRKFVEVVRGTKGATKSGLAQQAIDLIGELYAVEHKADERHLDADGRKALRFVEASPVLERLKGFLDEHAPKVPPKSLLGKAISYARGQWDRLIVYREDGRLRLDNNLAENAIRPFVIGRKNWLFSGSPRGADSSALLYSLIETAKANGLEPYAYLRTLFTELPKATTEDRIRALLPQHIDRTRIITGA